MCLQYEYYETLYGGYHSLTTSRAGGGERVTPVHSIAEGKESILRTTRPNTSEVWVCGKESKHFRVLLHPISRSNPLERSSRGLTSPGQ